MEIFRFLTIKHFSGLKQCDWKNLGFPPCLFLCHGLLFIQNIGILCWYGWQVVCHTTLISSELFPTISTALTVLKVSRFVRLHNLSFFVFRFLMIGLRISYKDLGAPLKLNKLVHWIIEWSGDIQVYEIVVYQRDVPSCPIFGVSMSLLKLTCHYFFPRSRCMFGTTVTSAFEKKMGPCPSFWPEEKSMAGFQ